MIVPSLLFGLLFLTATSVFAAEIEGITFPDTMEVAGKKLVLHGIGLRTATAFNIKIFGAVLYAPEKGHTETEILNTVRPIHFSEIYIRSIGRSMSVPGFRDIFKEVGGAELPAVQPEIDRFLEWLPSFEKKGGMSITWLQDKVIATHIDPEGHPKAPFESVGKFGPVLLRVWMSPKADERLKQALLGAQAKN